MTPLDNHLDQITTSAKAIASLEFPPPKIFTNALLGHHEITTLIRDTEPHERSLFTVDPGMINEKSSTKPRRVTFFGTDGPNRRKTIGSISQRQTSAVAKVLGSDMLKRIQQSSRSHGRSKGVDVEVLLRGAEKLCAVYPVAGAHERISSLRKQFAQKNESVSYYEALVLKQQAKVKRMNSHAEQESQMEEENMEDVLASNEPMLTEDDLLTEQAEIKELEAKKKALEDRIASMEQDLGGLLR